MMQKIVIRKEDKKNDNTDYFSSSNIGTFSSTGNTFNRLYPDIIRIGRHSIRCSSYICTVCNSPLNKEGHHKEK